MYHINDKSSAIRDIQRFLLAISQYNDYLPHISVDGIYNDELKYAVKEFQSFNRLPITGTVDSETFKLIYEAYTLTLLTEESKKESLNSESFPLKIGDSGNDVAVLNSLLRELTQRYPDLRSPMGDFFSLDTEYSVIMLQDIFNFEKSGIADEIFIKRLKNEVNAGKNLNALNKKP